MKSKAMNSFLVHLIGQGKSSGGLWHGSMEDRVKTCILRDFRKQCFGGLNQCNGGRNMHRSKMQRRLQLMNQLRGNALVLTQKRAAMDDAMSYCREPCVWGKSPQGLYRFIQSKALRSKWQALIHESMVLGIF